MCTIEEEEGREMMGEVENGEVVGRWKVVLSGRETRSNQQSTSATLSN